MGFEFSKNLVDLEIRGRKYEVDPFGEKILAGTSAFYKEIQAVNGDDSSPDSVKRTCDCVAKFVATVLGEGAYAEIFKGREPNFFDHQELVSWLLGSIAAYRVKRTAELTEQGVAAAKEILGKPATELH